VVEYLKVQGYNVTVATDLDTLATEAPNHHAFLFTDANTAVMGDVGRLSEESGGMPFSAGTGLDATGQKTKAKMLVFDQKNDIDTSISKENMIVSKYPVDLRNIDLVLGGLLSDTLPESPLNTAGTLKPVKSGKVVIGRLETNPVLIVHSSKEVRSALVQLTQRDGISIEETSDGSVAINLARTMKQELRLLIIGLPIANGPAEEVIKTIMSLPFHRRLKVIVVMKAMPEKRIIVALIQLGVRHFIIELELLEKIPVALQELLPC
jgi:CheY-like chemotaxis protein